MNTLDRMRDGASSRLLEYLACHHPQVVFIKLHHGADGGDTLEHLHKDLFQLTGCIRGKGFLRILPHEFTPDEFCFYLINPNELHALGPLSKESFQDNITCRFALPGFAGPLLQSEIRLNPAEAAEAEGILCRIHACLLRGTPVNGIRAGLLLTELLLLLEERCRSQEIGQRLSPLIRQALEYIGKNFRSGDGIDAVATACGVSASHLSRAFRKETGQTPLSYLHRVRLGFALERLFRTRMKVADIAAESGFESSKNLNLAFQRIYKMSPTELRNRYQEPEEMLTILSGRNEEIDN